MKKYFNLKSIIFWGAMALPLIVFTVDAGAAPTATKGLTDLGGLVDTFTKTVVRALSTMFATLALVAFFFGIVKYIWGIRDGDAGEIKKGQAFMGWALLALFVMFSVWGIVKFGQGILFGNINQNVITIPRIEFDGSKGGKDNTNPFIPGGVDKKSDGTSPTIPGGSVTGGGTASAPADNCAGGRTGACTVSGRAGTCGYDDEQNYWVCNANPGGTTGTTGLTDTKCNTEGQACIFEGSNGTCKPEPTEGQYLVCETN